MTNKMAVGVASSHESIAPLSNRIPAHSGEISRLNYQIAVLNSPFEHIDLLDQDVKSHTLREPSEKTWGFLSV
jgi:hypothetical protein